MKEEDAAGFTLHLTPFCLTPVLKIFRFYEYITDVTKNQDG
ncbi:MAG: hypothetical protein ABI707_09395 [Ferruginibacter sp.]